MSEYVTCVTATGCHSAANVAMRSASFELRRMSFARATILRESDPSLTSNTTSPL